MSVPYIQNIPQTTPLNSSIFSITTKISKVEPDPVTILENPIVLACTIKRLREKYLDDPDDIELNSIRKPPHVLLIGEDESIISSFITDDDRILAKTIHLHYSQKLTWMLLRGDNISSFRRELNKFLTNDTNIYTFEQCKIAYKLPYFYEYDMEMPEIFGGTQRSLTISGTTPKLKKKLKYIKKLYTHRRGKNTFEYWFGDEDDNRVLVEIDKLNPLLILWENHILKNDILVNCRFTPAKKDQFEYYTIPPSFSWEMTC